MKYPKIRTGLLTFILGLSGIPFFNGLYDKWTQIKVDLPQTQSASPLVVVPENPSLYNYNEVTSHKFTGKELTESRDLSLYDLGGKFSNCANIEISEFRKCLIQQYEARNFISTHLTEKKRGYIIYEWSGVDTGSTTHIFVEPNSNGKWSVILRTAGDFRYPRLREIKGYSTKYKHAKSDDDYPFEIGTSFLTILDENRKEVKRL